MAATPAFGGEGKVKADIELQPLSLVNTVLERLGRGDVLSRGFLEFHAHGSHLTQTGRFA